MDHDKVVVTYNGRILTESDLKFLKSSCYIPHRLIGTYFYYLKFQTAKPSKILLVDPTTTFEFLNHPEITTIQGFLDILRFQDMEVVLFPVNNMTELGGIESVSHWSLLVYDRSENLYNHFDSSSDRENEDFARELYMLTSLFTGSGTVPKYAEVPTPKQTNKYDSGLFVMKMASVICKWYANGRRMHRSYEPCDCATMICNWVLPSLETEMRIEVQRLVNAAYKKSNPWKDRPATCEENCTSSSTDLSCDRSQSENHVHSTMDKDVVVWYKGHELRKSDLEVLKGPCYVTDNLIDFYFCLLSERFDDRGVILFIRPSISRWIAICNEPEDIVEFVSHLNLRARRFVLFPVNNDMALEGVEWTQPHTHWTLLVYDTATRYFIHFYEKREDTFLNGVFAEQVYKKVKSLMPWVPTQKNRQPPPPELIMIKTAKLAKGFNNYDSGLHVMAEAKIICEWRANLIERFDNGVSMANMPMYLELLHGMDVSVEKNTRLEIKKAIERITGKNIKELLQ